jgi:hypothetical protein
MNKVNKLLNIWEMANIRPNKTGLPMVIWIKPKTTEKHGPRIKVQISHGDKIKINNWVSISIEDSPQLFGSGLSIDDFNLIVKFIKNNKDNLLKVWNDEIDPIDFVNIIIKN